MKLCYTCYNNSNPMNFTKITINPVKLRLKIGHVPILEWRKMNESIYLPGRVIYNFKHNPFELRNFFNFPKFPVGSVFSSEVAHG